MFIYYSPLSFFHNLIGKIQHNYKLGMLWVPLRPYYRENAPNKSNGYLKSIL